MSKIDLKIRPVTKNDTLELIPVVRSYIVDFYKCPDPTDNELENHINYLVDNPGSGKQFLMEKNGEIIGFATLYFTFSTTKVKAISILNDLFISSEYRGKGLGEMLFKYALEFSKENGYAVMNWKTSHDNLKAQALYKKMGGVNTNNNWINYEITL
ncbi:GNAT family N-acetyltransferase [Bacillus siamensis]|uniref:GNAT family N-acetyltransferase n=1 Tax=Bacillus siamensis TaxID=659243 RepID=UPI0018E62890|nr:GNAT family N-acetyltransferase [Bacillus siamensis]QQD82701.1 GNAT family N-acetyltransferase [Bacillus siamensis]